MENYIYEFLEKYYGDGINVVKLDIGDVNNFFSTNYIAYRVLSDSEITIMYLTVSQVNGEVCMSNFNSEPLSNMFSLPRDKSNKHIENWFFNKHQIKDYKELLKYIVTDKN